MGLPKPTYARALKHTRHVDMDFHRREDGLWEIDAHFVDVKPIDINLRTFFLPANIPIHNLWLRLTMDCEFNILESKAHFDNVPLAGFCDTIQEAYQNLAGLNLFKDFRQSVRERFGNADGCAHLNELLDLLPLAAIEALNDAGDTPKKTPCQICPVALKATSS